MRVLKNKSILITGARGLIGSRLIDSIMYENIHNNLECNIYAVGRNREAAKERFGDWWEHNCFKFIEADINIDRINIECDVDYVVHGASNTHPIYYATKPIETIKTNTIGTYNILDFAYTHNSIRTLFLSSVEIYGENRGDTDAFDERYVGYIDCNTLRAGYPESKRVGESLCQAYIKEYGLDIVIPRISRCYGPGLLIEDSKAMSQFLRKAMQGENIVLKSSGKQFFSYVYVDDVVSAIILLLERGISGEAYNVSGDNSDITLGDLAELIARNADCRVIYEEPDKIENAGYSTASKAVLNTKKIKSLGWKSHISIEEGIRLTMNAEGK